MRKKVSTKYKLQEDKLSTGLLVEFSDFKIEIVRKTFLNVINVSRL